MNEEIKDLLMDALALVEPRAEDFQDDVSGCIVRGNEAAKDLCQRIRDELAKT